MEKETRAMRYLLSPSLFFPPGRIMQIKRIKFEKVDACKIRFRVLPAFVEIARKEIARRHYTSLNRYDRYVALIVVIAKVRDKHHHNPAGIRVSLFSAIHHSESDEC